jgi:hypothetical protein
MMTKIIAIGSFFLSGVVFVATSIIAFGYWGMPNQVKNIGDWIILLIPIIAPTVSLLLGFVILSNRVINKTIYGLFVGALIGISIYMLIPALQIVFKFNTIAKDGTAYWGIMMMPVIYIAIPLLLVGGIVGLIVGYKIEKKTKTV